MSLRLMLRTLPVLDKEDSPILLLLHSLWQAHNPHGQFQEHQFGHLQPLNFMINQGQWKPVVPRLRLK